MPHSLNPAAEAGFAGGAPVAGAGAAPPIARLPTAVTAFVGRTLKGPLNMPCPVTSFAEFQRQFGGLWQPAPLGYAVEQFFENGGRQALIVRVANGARAPTLRLPAGPGELLLQGRDPGTREYLRASVDYDGIGAADADQFNLVLQRLRAADSELIEEQEILRRLSIRPEAERAVDRVLAGSRLMRTVGPLPPERVDGVRSGRTAGSGLAALRDGPRFELLCVPPLGREQDVGLATLLVAARLCRARQALLVVDPPRGWDSAAAALEGARDWAFQSEHALLYFPRLLATDRLRGRLEVFAPCGAAAGLIARGDEASPPWAAAAGDAPLLRAPLRPQILLDEAQRLRLAQVGVNCFDHVRPAAGAIRSARTLLPESAARGEWRFLPARRLSLWLQACVLEGTSWMRSARSAPLQWQRACDQVEDFLESLAVAGAFAGRDSDERYFVISDARLNTPELAARGRSCLLFGFAAWRPGEFQTCLVTHERSGSSVRAVTINRLATSGARVAEEIETAILRQLVAELPADRALG